MDISTKQKRVIEQTVNAFETGTLHGRYDALVVMKDGPSKKPQITFGRSQTTEYGNLKKLLLRYIELGGKFSEDFKPYLPKLGIEPLSQDINFKSKLKQAGSTDPVMQQAQDTFFDGSYYIPAINWGTKNGFTLPLSALVIYDSYIHSGRVPDFLREKFSEKVPAAGGAEKEWIKAYVKARRAWLATAENPILHSTVYRMDCMAARIAEGNWLLEVPFKTQGVLITGEV
jgi:chitosanase